MTNKEIKSKAIHNLLKKHNIKFKKRYNDEAELKIYNTPYQLHITNQYYYVVNNDERVGYAFTPHFETIEETETYLLEVLSNIEKTKEV